VLARAAIGVHAGAVDDGADRCGRAREIYVWAAVERGAASLGTDETQQHADQR
jgi:hypothetical protein